MKDKNPMNHVFRAKRMGWEEKREGIHFNADYYTQEEATAQFKPVQGTTRDGFPYVGYEYGGVKYHNFQYLGVFPQNAMPRNDDEYLAWLIDRGKGELQQ